MKKILTTLALVGVITTGAQAQSILISEINSNGTGGDFFEIYNYGATAVELGGWKWVDNASAVNGGPSFNGARAFAFDAFTLNPGGIALVVTDANGNAAGNTAFATSWGLTGANFLTFNTGVGTGNGLGQNDLVAIFDSAGVFHTGLNYGTVAVTITNGDLSTVSLAPFNRVGGGTSAGGHAGVAGGGPATQSLIWDPASPVLPVFEPLYTAASSVGLYGSFENPNNAVTIGSPSVVPEPSTYAMLALAGIGLAAYRLRRRARR
jgi:hypothetical protein